MVSLEDLEHVNVLSTSNEKEADQPPNFKVKLRAEQLRALEWAKGRDQSSETFCEEEIVEGQVRRLGYRLEAKATREVTPKGGLLFFDVGFGKTAVTLALIQSWRVADRNSVEESLKGKFASQATLVVVPSHLTGQWRTEFAKFVETDEDDQTAVKSKTGGPVIVIDKITDLRHHTIQEFIDAELLIVSSSLLDNGPYMAHLAEFSGLVDVEETRSLRVKSVWYKEACSKVSMHVDKLKTDPTTLHAHIQQEYVNQLKAADSTAVYVPTKRTRGANYVPVNERQVDDAAKTSVTQNKRGKKRKAGDVDREESENPLQKEKSATEKVQKVKLVKERNDIFGLKQIAEGGDKYSMKCPLFEMFRFARVVMDEPQYLAKFQIPMMENITGVSRWLLCGTPNLSSFGEIKKMARLFGVNLGIDDFASMKPEEFKAATEDMTSIFHYSDAFRWSALIIFSVGEVSHIR